MGRKIICTNNDGMSITFSDDKFSPFILANVEGIYSHDNNVSYVENTMIDGGTYQGTVASVRNIVLTILDRPLNVFNQENRDVIYALFEQGQKGTLTFVENGSERAIDYYVESIHRTNIGTKAITISLICLDPFFYETNWNRAEIAGWVAGFEFVHEFVAEGEELGYRQMETSHNIVNDNAEDNIGIEITITAIGPVVNPLIARVESNEQMWIGTPNNRLELTTGQKVVVTTDTGNKHVRLIDTDSTESEINQYLSEDSTFIQLHRGNNTIGYEALSGGENMVVTIRWKYKYGGA